MVSVKLSSFPCFAGGYNYNFTAGAYSYNFTGSAQDAGHGDDRFRQNISFPLEMIAAFFFSLVVLIYTIHKRLQLCMHAPISQDTC
jgi:hypothetical protein